MTTLSLEQRVELLESQYADVLKILRGEPVAHAWRQVVGMFADDPEIEKLHEETRRIREQDRAATRDSVESAT
jgi:hypothetical protein